MTYEEVEKNNIIEKYLNFELIEQEEIEFEEHLLFNEKTRQELEKAEKILVGFREIGKRVAVTPKTIKFSWTHMSIAASIMLVIGFGVGNYSNKDINKNYSGVKGSNTTNTGNTVDSVSGKLIIDIAEQVVIEGKGEPNSEIRKIKYEIALDMYNALINEMEDKSKLQNDSTYYKNYIDKAELHFMLNELDIAIETCKKALSIIKNNKEIKKEERKEDIFKIYKTLMVAYTVKGNMKKAFEYLTILINDDNSFNIYRIDKIEPGLETLRQSPFYFYLLTGFYAANNDFSNALLNLKKVLKKNKEIDFNIIEKNTIFDKFKATIEYENFKNKK